MLNKFKKIVKFVLGPFIILYRSNDFKKSVAYANFIKYVKVKENVVLYESYHGKNATCNPYAIFLALSEDEKYKNFIHVWALNELNGPTATLLKQYKNVKVVSRFSIKYLYYQAKAKYLINNTSFPTYFQKKHNQIYVNTWHGTPLKQIGADTNESGISEHGNIQKNLLHADYLVSPNEFTHTKLLQSNRVHGIFNGKIIDAGYPRVDLTVKTNPLKMKKILGIKEDKKVILYAPTWREWDKGNEKSAVERTYNLFKKLKEKYSDDYEVILKVHYFVYLHFKKEGLEKYCVPDWIDTNEILSCVDILITDYSSIFFDYLHTKKPIIFFMYDLEEYSQRRGFYLDINDLPGPICKSIEEVSETINSIGTVTLDYLQKYQMMLEKYCYNDDGNATSRVVDIIFNGNEKNYVSKIENPKRKILFWGGGFATNGITISFLNLLNNIDYSKYEVSIIVNKIDDQNIDNIKKINPSANVIFRKGNINYLIREHYAHRIVYNLGLHKNWVRKLLPINLYKKELNRVIGNSKFDIAIDFDGYTPLWSLSFAFSDFKKKFIYLHSDMVADSRKVINGKVVHRNSFNIIFNIYKYFDKMICVSKDATEINKAKLEKYGVSEKIININNSIDYNRIIGKLENVIIGKNNGKEYLIQEDNEKGFELPNSENVNFVTLGRLSPEKDFEKLIKAFSIVNNKYRNTCLYVIGDGVLMDHLQQLAKSLGVKEQVKFVGHMDNPFALMERCDCFVLSSNYEGQGLVILEALILEKAVVSTNIPGPRGILEDGYGKLVDNSVDGLVEGMEDYIVNRPIYKKFDFIEYNNKAIQSFYKEICE